MGVLHVVGPGFYGDDQQACLIIDILRGGTTKTPSLLSSRRTSNNYSSEDESWDDREVAGCKFKDLRLGESFRKLLKQIGSAISQAIPFACQDWASTKAAYRFFSNDRVDEEAILCGHFQATHDRFAATDGYVLVLHDTTEFSFKREKPELIGSTCKVRNTIRPNQQPP